MTGDEPPGAGGHDETTEVLDEGLFAFELDAEVRRASRTHANLTLVVIRSGSGADGASTPPPDGLTAAVAARIRDTDVLGQSAGGLQVMFVDLAPAQSAMVIDRLLAGLASEGFARPLAFAVGAASYPADALDGPSLSRAARARIATRRSSRP